MVPKKPSPMGKVPSRCLGTVSEADEVLADSIRTLIVTEARVVM